MAWADTFTRANQATWGTASDGEIWAQIAGTATLSIARNQGVLAGGNALDLSLLGSRSGSNLTGIVRISMTGDNHPGLVLRCDGTNQNFYVCLIYPNALEIWKTISGGASLLQSVAVTINTGTEYWLKFAANTSALSGKVWADGSAEPGAWNASITDTDLTSGQVGLHAFANGGITSYYDNFLVQSVGNTLITNKHTGIVF